MPIAYRISRREIFRNFSRLIPRNSWHSRRARFSRDVFHPSSRRLLADKHPRSPMTRATRNALTRAFFKLQMNVGAFNSAVRLSLGEPTFSSCILEAHTPFSSHPRSGSSSRSRSSYQTSVFMRNSR